MDAMETQLWEVPVLDLPSGDAVTSHATTVCTCDF